MANDYPTTRSQILINEKAGLIEIRNYNLSIALILQ